MFRWRRFQLTKARRARQRPALSYQTHKEAARELIVERVRLYAAVHGFTYNRIAIKNTRRSWGSCSSKGNLNFNYKLLFLPPCLRDYIIVHELCHLRVLNHGRAFWDEVVAIMPDAPLRAAALRMGERHYGISIEGIRKYIPAAAFVATDQALEQNRAAVFVPPERERSERFVR